MDNTKIIDQLIDDASKDSFPASDPPAWTTGLDRERLKSKSETNEKIKDQNNPSTDIPQSKPPH